MNEKTYDNNFHLKAEVLKMKYTSLGRTDMKVSLMSLGGGPLGELYGPVSEEEAIQVVWEGVKKGINYIDTSPWYGQGRSEMVLGKALDGIPRHCYYIGTKVGRYEQDLLKMFDFSKEKTRQSVTRSLQLLGLNYVDLIQVHDFEFADDVNIILTETLPTLQQIVKEGKARYIGITSYSMEALKEVVEKSTVNIDTVLCHTRNTLIEDGLKDYIPYFESKGIGVINAGVIAMGLLTHGTPVEWHPAHEEVQRACAHARKYCEDNGFDLAHLSTQFSVATPGVATHLIGANDRCVLNRALKSVTEIPTEYETETALKIRHMFFSPLSRRHWEGDDPKRFKEKLKKAKIRLEEEKKNK